MGLGLAILTVGFFFMLATVVVSKILLPNNARHKFIPNPMGACVVVLTLGFAVVLGLAVITTGALVVIILDRVDVAILVSNGFFVVSVFKPDIDGCGNRSIIIGSEDKFGDGRFLMTLRFVFAFVF